MVKVKGYDKSTRELKWNVNEIVFLLFVSYKAYYAHPMVAAAVIIHLAADGTADIDQRQHNITVQLVDTNEQTHSLG